MSLPPFFIQKAIKSMTLYDLDLMKFRCFLLQISGIHFIIFTKHETGTSFGFKHQISKKSIGTWPGKTTKNSFITAGEPHISHDRFPVRFSQLPKNLMAFCRDISGCQKR